MWKDSYITILLLWNTRIRVVTFKIFQTFKGFKFYVKVFNKVLSYTNENP